MLKSIADNEEEDEEGNWTFNLALSGAFRVEVISLSIYKSHNADKSCRAFVAAFVRG